MVQERRDIMGMPVTVAIADVHATSADCNVAFDYLTYVDETFSTYKDTSEIMSINRGELSLKDASDDMREVFRLSEQTKAETNGYFSIELPDGTYDPSGLVKGWAIKHAADMLRGRGFEHFFVEIAGDAEVAGTNGGEPWRVGIRHPWEHDKVAKTLALSNVGIATSGTYERGTHVYDPTRGNAPVSDIVSLTVIGPNVYEADRFATAAFAMGRRGIEFIASLPGFEGFMIDNEQTGTSTVGFNRYEC